MDYIKVRGARQHNLKNINLDIPKNKLVVFTGVSGSGKSSLAFDTIYAEGQRRYVESLSSYARQFLGIMDKPDIDHIEGLSPSISIDQKSTSHNPRSTVGTVTEIYDYFRLLFARIGHPHCPNCGREVSRQSTDQIVSGTFNYFSERFALKVKQVRVLVLAPIVRDRKGEFTSLLENLKVKGFSQVRLDGKIMDISNDLVLLKTNKHTIEAVVDRISITVKEFRDEVARSNLKSRLSQAIEQSTTLSDGLVIVSEVTDPDFEFPTHPTEFHDQLYSENFSCPVCNISIPEIEPRSFSFNSPHGACQKCGGIGSLLKIDPELVFNPNLTVSEGGILPYAKMFFHETWFSRLVATLAQELQIDLRIPIRTMPKAHIKILLEGTGDQPFIVSGENRFGRPTQIRETFPGLVADLEKRYRETESEFIRTEIEKFMRKEVCPTCLGTRLKKDALSITISDKSIADISDLSITHALEWSKLVTKNVSEREKTIGTPILKEISARLTFLTSVGLEYLTISRSANSLSGGEAQRIRLASQIGSGLSGVLYVLDEPSIGLHPRDNRRLIETLKMLRDLGNTVVVVEHDREVMEESDWIFDFGPGAGREGGNVIFSGTVEKMKSHPNTSTGKYLKRKDLISFPRSEKIVNQELTLLGARGFNLKGIDVTIPLGKLVCVTGVSGSGKSTLVVDTLYQVLAGHFNPLHRDKPSPYAKIEGLEHLDKIILVDQSPIGRTPRSNPATYTGLFTQVRELFSTLPESRVRGYTTGRFSFNVRGGRCEACEGEGQIKIEMQFLSDVYVTCEVCHGKRYNSETLEVTYHGKHIADVLDLTISDAIGYFERIPKVREKLMTLKEVGLGYMQLGQPAPTLSGGEAQRVKLATELTKRQTGKTMYILDEPTTGLHFADLEKLMHVLKKLTEFGNTVLVIEHNLDVIKNADHIIDLGPDGGDKGGFLIGAGTPEEIVKNPRSHTGKFLKEYLK